MFRESISIGRIETVRKIYKVGVQLKRLSGQRGTFLKKKESSHFQKAIKKLVSTAIKASILRPGLKVARASLVFAFGTTPFRYMFAVFGKA
jgi:hypothetical protein